jgi:hypothetical protein
MSGRGERQGSDAPAPRLDDGLPEYRFPDFLCIGAQKAGTTWLDSNLRRHPKLWLPPMKELQFFSHLHLPHARRWTGRQRHERGTQLLRRYIQNNAQEEWDYRYIARLADLVAGPVTDDWYGRMFALARPGQVCGEVTPDYCTLPEDGIAHVLRLSPEVRIIFSLRDPIERSWSHIRMTARGRGISEVEKLEHFARQADQLQRGNYPAIIARWRKFIPEDRFLVIFMDDIVSAPNTVLEKVCAFLGVPYREKPFAKAANPVHVGEAQEIPPTVLGALKESFRPVYAEVAALYPEIGARWAAKYY